MLHSLRKCQIIIPADTLRRFQCLSDVSVLYIHYVHYAAAASLRRQFFFMRIANPVQNKLNIAIRKQGKARNGK